MDDIAYALRVIDVSQIKNKDILFHSRSSIYKVTNEQIPLYYESLKNSNKILSVVGSGDQIIDAIIDRPKEIDCFDISVYPIYFLQLKLAAIKSLTKEEYISLFIDDPLPAKDEYYDDLYFDKIKPNLTGKYLEFWSSLFNHADWYDIYTSILFFTEEYPKDVIISRLNYLQDDNYYQVRNNIDQTIINFKEGNILDIYREYQDKYDLVYLSNISQYVDLKEYLTMLDHLPLKENGESISYVYKVTNAVKKYFNQSNNTYLMNDETGPAVILHKS